MSCRPSPGRGAHRRGCDVPMVHLLLALPCEAGPLIDALALRAVSGAGPFRQYRDQDGGLSLTVTGTGIARAAAAVMDTRHRYPPAAGQVHGWLNVGIAGHARHAPGQAFLASAVYEPDAVHSHFPQFVCAPPLPLLPLQSCLRPCVDHSVDDDRLKDMEAGGFYAMASRLAPAECVHCLKIVSDNAEQGPETLSAQRISDWVRGQLPAIHRCIAFIRDCCTTLSAPQLDAQLQCFYRHARFTVSQRNQLRRLLLRWRVLWPDQDPQRLLAAGDDARGILHSLQQSLEQAVFLP